MREPCFLWDIDGTLADIEHRVPLISGAMGSPNWSKFFDRMVDDEPILEMISLCNIIDGYGHQIIFVTGRPESHRQQTIDWFEKNGVEAGWKNRIKMYMRQTGNYDPDYQVKERILAQIRKDGYEPRMVFDDRNQVVEMWRRNGIRCLQVADGNY